MTDSNTKYRKLSAIMFTDMVGYSSLTQNDEKLALELLQQHRTILRKIFIKYRGTEIETAGDSFFVEFESALEAANCAIEIQEALHEHNKRAEPHKQILIRIGLHVGDVMHLENHVHGDGVNIAARLEPLSLPGGICLSEDVYRQIYNKLEYTISSLGKKNLKNIKSPVEVYSIDLPWLRNNKNKLIRIIPKLKAPKLFSVLFLLLLISLIVVLFKESQQNQHLQLKNNRIAVLPLMNISNGAEDDYFTDGMTEELISQLAKISGLNVIARTSVMKYKNTEKDISQIGKDLDVSSILEGSVRTMNEKTRINVQLVDVNTQQPIWTEEYDRELKDIFAIQSDIALNIAKQLKIQLLSSERMQIQKTGTSNSDAYKYYLLGKQQLNLRTANSIFKSIDYFRTSSNIDPDYAFPLVGIADCYTLIGGAGFGNFSRNEAIRLAKDAVYKALEIDNTFAEAYNSLAYLQFRLEWDWENAESNFKKAIELKPGYAGALEHYALFLALLGRYDKALQLMLRAYELDPLSASISTGVGRIYHFAEDYDAAIYQFKKTLATNPNYVEAVFALGMSYAKKQMFKDAIEQLKKAVEISNGRMIIMAALGNTYADAGRIDEAMEIYHKLETASKEKKVSPLYFAVIDAALGNRERAIDSLYKAYDEHFGILVYIKASPLYDNLRKEERFSKLMTMIGLQN